MSGGEADMAFLSVRHNSFSVRGTPWAQKVVQGLTTGPACEVCGVESYRADGPISVLLEPGKGVEWPDVLGCGAYPFFIVSARVLEIWQDEGVGSFPHHRVDILPPFPGKIATPPPEYCWIDGSKMRGAAIDFDASGFVGVRFCPGCGNRTDDVGATYDRRRSGTWPFQIVAGSWNGAKLFTTDLSPTKFFCTQDVLHSAARHRLTNFRFLRAEDGDDAASKGIAYLSGGRRG